MLFSATLLITFNSVTCFKDDLGEFYFLIGDIMYYKIKIYLIYFTK